MAKSPYTNLRFPLNGQSEHEAYGMQWDGTTADARNVRGYDPRTGRLRGGQRSGHTRYLSSSFGAIVQHLTHVSASTAYTGSGAASRSITGVAVAGGSVYTFTSSGSTASTSGSGALSSTFPWVDSATLFGVVYFVDGTNAKKLTVSTNTVAAWTASAGSMPSNGANLPSLICAYRGRIVLSGIKGDDQNWFMSAVNDATDFDYSPTTPSATQAVAGNNSLAGQCQDRITALIPYRDDLLWLGGDSSIWQMSGDPASGGQLDLISDVTGVAFGQAWCKDPQGVVYFFGSRGGLYAIVPGAPPQKLSGRRIDERLADIDLSTTVVKLAWDDRQQTVMIYCTPVGGTATVHYAYDTRTQAFWMDAFSDVGHNPLCAHVFDGDTPGDRAVLLGCRDGYIRKIDVDSKQDDDAAIDSYAFFGPFQSAEGRLRLRETRLSLGENSDKITVGLYGGVSPEAALSSEAVSSFTHDPKLEATRTVGVTGNAIYLKLRNCTIGESWSYESGLIRLESTSAVAGRRV